jgi:hypothetical protein
MSRLRRESAPWWETAACCSPTTTASDICDAVLSSARGRGSMSMVAHASCLHSMIMRRIGRLDEADAVAAAATRREPPAGWIHTATFLQARGGLRVAQGRHAEALDDLLTAGEAWRALGIGNPAEQLALARQAGTPATLGAALRVHAAAAEAGQSGPPTAGESLAEAVGRRRRPGGRPNRRGRCRAGSPRAGLPRSRPAIGSRCRDVRRRRRTGRWRAAAGR